jgi:hypothetical protein
MEASVEIHEGFNARGMSRVYGRGDHLPGVAAYNMDIWKDRAGRLLVRFWSRNADVDWVSYEIVGVRKADLPEGMVEEAWIPACVREEYDTWIVTN